MLARVSKNIDDVNSVENGQIHCFLTQFISLRQNGVGTLAQHVGCDIGT